MIWKSEICSFRGYLTSVGPLFIFINYLSPYFRFLAAEYVRTKWVDYVIGFNRTLDWRAPNQPYCVLNSLKEFHGTKAQVSAQFLPKFQTLNLPAFPIMQVLLTNVLKYFSRWSYIFNPQFG